MPIPSSSIKKLQIKHLTPFPNTPEFGVEASGIDLNNLSEDEFLELEHAIYTHRVVILKGQKGLLPPAQQALGIRFDPETPAELGHMREYENKTTLLNPASNEKKPELEGAWLVNINGSGTFDGTKHYGVGREFTLKGLGHRGFHKDELPVETTDAGHVRFQRWHIDAPFYKKNPARVTTIWAHTMPDASNKVDVHWDDGSGFVKQAAPGTTAFFDCVALYNQLSPEDKAWVDNSLIVYPPSPYQQMAGAKADGLGLRLVNEGKEAYLANPDSVADVDPEGAQTIPLIWTNPISGEKALQVHAIIASGIKYRTSPDAEFTDITDLATVRQMLDNLQRPFITPENVFFAPTEEGDMLCFYNRGVRHSAVEFPASRGNRLLHQLQLVASDPPYDPAPLKGQPWYKDLPQEVAASA